ncbi:MAG TPA: hypothetical protein VND95_04230 [Stellaceae bacterium]|nr:hypothetical protein [Stellaceae bacterium]
MMAAAFDTLEISKRLKSVGFDDAQAEAITGVLRESREADLSKLATKDDIAHVKDDIARVKDDIAHLATELRAEMEILRRDLTIRLGGMIVVATGVLLAAKFFG